MNRLLPLVVLFLSFSLRGTAQTVDLTKNLTAAERKAILDALRSGLKPDLRLLPKLMVASLKQKGNFAFFAGRVRNAAGGNIDFRKTVYREALAEGLFDGDDTHALLKKTGGNWKVLAYAIGPTDVPWGCWWKEFKAPRVIFDYTEDCE